MSLTDVSALINDPTAVKEQRLNALGELLTGEPTERPCLSGKQINNHVHSFYSFSPYSPSMIVLHAYQSGLDAVGLVDHDTVAGAEEFIEAGKMLQLPVTVGLELRTYLDSSELAKRKTNSPDIAGLTYPLLHGIPRRHLQHVKEFLQPIRMQREQRNQRQLARLNELISTAGLPAIDYQQDVRPLSQAATKGSVTERHLLQALAQHFLQHFGMGKDLLQHLGLCFRIQPLPQIKERLLEPQNPYALFDLLGLLKSEFLPKFFLNPSKEECPPFSQVVQFANSLGLITTYPHLGDVQASPTGDKKAETFEDAFLDPLFTYLKDVGVAAVSYMPPRNSRKQLRRIQDFCRRYGLMEISGVDIHSPRQSFLTPLLEERDFQSLCQSNWTLMAHQLLADIKPEWALFHPQNPLPSLERKMETYARLGQQLPLMAGQRREEYAAKALQGGFL